MNKITKQINSLSTLNKCILMFLLLCCTSVFAQREAAIWYYGGKGGLDFNTGKPVFLSDGQLDGGNEGCATVSDKQGKLLFYTDGNKVYNRNHIVMPNGSMLLGVGTPSQSAIIIQKPGTTDKYYIFTVSDQVDQGIKGFNYYEVDLSLNGGLGDIISINNGDIGLPSTPIATPVTEKLTAIAHSDGKQIWVICHSADNNNNFLAYLVSATGVNTTPVVSSIGFVNDYAFGVPNNCVGYLKTSPNGKKIAAATAGSTLGPLSVGLELFDFDTATGIISNRQVLNSLSNYGVEFSTDSKVLYATNDIANQIVQYDITRSTEAAIKQSEVIMPSLVKEVFALQLAIDGKIYVARGGNQGAQGAINNPKALGLACGYVPNTIYSGTASPGLGLPNFLPSLFEEKIKFDGLCAGSPTTLTINPYIDIVSPTWNFGDPTSASNTSTDVVPTHTYTKEGIYTVNVVFFNSDGLKIEITSTVTIFSAVNATKPADISVCDTGNGTAIFDVTPQTAIVLGSQAATDFTVTYYTTPADADAGTNAITGNLAAYTSASGTIYAKVQNNISECYAVTTFELIVTPLPVVAQIPTFTTCDTGAIDGLATFNLVNQESALVNGQAGVTVTYFTTQADADANTNAIATPASFTNTTSPQTIYVRLNGALCFATGSFTIETLAVPALADDLSIEGCSPFNLTAVIAEVGTDFTLGYYTSEADATANSNAIATPNAYPMTGDKGTVYIRADNSEGCFSIAPLALVTGACQIQRGISPGDGDKNNTFDLTNFNVTKITIFNRYGKEVYSKNNYKNEWGGQGSNGDDLPTGTYFYTFSSPTAGNKTGWIYINRRS